METLTKRPALGERVAIGTLYDARADRFLPDFLLKPQLPESAFQIVAENKSDVSYSYGDTCRKRFKALDLPHALAGSVLADSVSCGGASRYLAEPLQGHSEHAVLRYGINTCTQTLNFQSAALQGQLTVPALSNPQATHMVAGIGWGSMSLISLRAYFSNAAESSTVSEQIQVSFASFASAVESLAGSASNTRRTLPPLPSTLQTEITVYSEMFDGRGGILLTDLQEAFEFLQLMPLHIRGENMEKGWPITYSLLPVQMLGLFLPVHIPQLPPIWYPPMDIVDTALSLFDGYLACEQKLKEHELELLKDAHYLPADRQRELGDRLQKLHTSKQRFITDFTYALSSAKSGRGDPHALQQIFQNYQQTDLSPEAIASVTACERGSLQFIQEAVALGAVYVGHNGVTLGQVLPTSPGSEAYVFFFTAASSKEEPWKENCDLLFELLQKLSPAVTIALVDCDATSLPLETVRIAQIQDGNEVIQDLLLYRSFVADKSFAECDEQTIESENIEPPIQRRHVTIACPGPKCSMAKVREWLCPRCMAPVEYGYTDKYIYCSCGRSLYNNYIFKCAGEMHGPHYHPYDPPKLLNLLNGLAQTNYLNILILGETGVGKSTFINAMVNYLEFNTLDEAIAAEKLNYVIPCSFATQIMDRSNPNNPIEEKYVKVGSRDDEKDGSKGDSATQMTSVYPVTFHTGDTTLTVRLIDTPGIGDSRGVDADRQNMADILSTLSGYDTVHGILILLKSNNARLNITFRYSIKELLTHLHQKAAANMAFGFTNTRISNYTPGDTFRPLKTLLAQHPDVGLHLETPTTYCFDSESFRYLAAHKNGVTMPNKLDFDRSWEQSREETVRLIHHFQTIPPHEVKNTMSLNGARQLISELTKPLAHITQIINTSIQLNEDQMAALKDTRIKGDTLRNMLHVQKVQMNAEQLPKPRTVCADKKCIEVRDDGKGQNNMVIVYKQHCHPQCYLNDVQADVLAHANLIRCAAFGGSNNCHKCRHHWSQHLHVLYELHEETVTMVDDGIQKQLANHADDITLREKAIATKEQVLAEYRQEQEIMRDAAAKFCVFLKNNSLAPYNDALVAYLDHLIKEEQAKVQAGGSDRKLLSLTEERQKHKEAIEVISRNMNPNAAWNDLNEAGVDRIVQSLYNLKHFGQTLKDMKRDIANAHQATYRERPYTVRRRNQPIKVMKATRAPINAPVGYQHVGQSGQSSSSGRPPNSVVVKRSSNRHDSGGGTFASMLKRGFGFS